MTPDIAATPGEDLVRRLWQHLWIERDFESLAGLLTDPYVRHNRDGTLSSTPTEYAARVCSVVAPIRGTRVEFDQLSEIDGRVWARLTLHGVYLDVGSTMSITWLSEYRIVGDQIAETWSMHQTDLDWNSGES